MSQLFIYFFVICSVFVYYASVSELGEEEIFRGRRAGQIVRIDVEFMEMSNEMV